MLTSPILGDRLTVDPDAKGMRGVVDQTQAVPPGDIGQCFQIAGVAIDMHRQDGGRPWRDRRFDFLRVQRVGFGFDVDKNRVQPAGRQRMGGSHKGKGCRDHFAGQLQALQGDLQS
jgi:hypothetical protein